MRSILALSLGAFAGVAHAQTSVQIYGNIDVGVNKSSGQTLNIGKRAANTLGFKGTEDLGNGLKALFQIEMRYEPDTGTTENGNNRPLFQGQTRVGLRGKRFKVWKFRSMYIDAEARRQALLTELNQRIREVRQGPDGLLYLLTDEENGALLRLEPVDAK